MQSSAPKPSRRACWTSCASAHPVLPDLGLAAAGHRGPPRRAPRTHRGGRAAASPSSVCSTATWPTPSRRRAVRHGRTGQPRDRRPPQHALLRIDRLYLSAAGHPVELAVSRFLPEYYSYRVRLRRNPHRGLRGPDRAPGHGFTRW
ncbi:hypothetical protein NKH18_17215 [Streptomyces sp. M10(2022)]